MQRNHGRLFGRKKSSAWGLTALLLLAMLGVSLVTDPEEDNSAVTNGKAGGPVQMETGPAIVDRAYAVSVGKFDEAPPPHSADGWQERRGD